MNPSHFPKFLLVLLLGLVMPVHADTMLYSNILGYFSIKHTEDCILLKADGSRQTERCTVNSSVRIRVSTGFSENPVSHSIETIRFNKNSFSITYDVRNSPRFYVDNAFQRSGKTDDGYLCFPDTRPDTAICISFAAANKSPFDEH
ncbi:hypothetical protein [Kingella denitrificans]|uniref:hypothetical protein n=1 Tax=Kingella denitrificans TaxID=502 RepID=UPI0028899CFA|nr:hypothetical protein [Kingella denitrificans]